MINETQARLKKIASKIDVSFVLLPSQQNVHDEFVKYLNTLPTTPGATPKTPPTSKSNASTIQYDKKSKRFITLFLINIIHFIFLQLFK
jgi:hypothetical protein